MNRLVKMIEKVQMTVGIFFLILFFVVIMIQIITRHLGIPVIWTVELAINSFIWAIFMGAAVMVNRRDHFNFNILERKIKGKAGTSLKIFNDIVIILFNTAIFIYGIQVTEKFWNYNWTSLPSLKMGYVWISIPIMGFTMVIYSVSHLISHIKMFKEKGVKE